MKTRSVVSIAREMLQLAAVGLITTGLVTLGVSVLKFLFTQLQQRRLKAKGQVGEHLTKHEEKFVSAVVDISKLDPMATRVAGLTAIRGKLREEVILPFKSPELFPEGALTDPSLGVLLYGPPGTGKTLLARWIAKESGATFIEVKVEQLFDKYVGESQKTVAALFSFARKRAPAVIFIDEIEGILGDHHSSGGGDHALHSQVKVIFLSNWDGLTNSSARSRVMIIGATNRPGMMDKSIQRRLSAQLEVALPTEAERFEILKMFLHEDKSVNCGATEGELKTIAKETHNWSGADLKVLCKKARMMTVRDHINTLCAEGEGGGGIDGTDAGNGNAGAQIINRGGSNDAHRNGPNTPKLAPTPTTAQCGAKVRQTSGVDDKGGSVVLRAIELSDIRAAFREVMPSASQYTLHTMENYLR